MQNAIRRRISPRNHRRGFTLVELIVVIVIIALLISLLVPVVNNILQTGRITEVRHDISQLENAITSFKTRFNMEPPSRFVLYEDLGDYLVADADPVRDAIRIRSQKVIRNMWPQFAFSGTVNWDNGTRTGPYYMNGSECLLFFLGGIIEPGSNPPNLLGFSKNPQQPFLATGDSREGPFMEFSVSRIVDVFNDTVGNSVSDAAADEGLDGLGVLGIPEYRDPISGQTRPYVYIHSDDYRAHDDTVDPSTSMAEYEMLSPPLPAVLLPRAYKQSDSLRSYYKGKTFQIISPGFDTEYGLGGIYEADDTTHDGTTGHIGRLDEDNITNFAPGELRQ